MSPLPSDDHLRALHAQSLQSLSPTTLGRLRHARHSTATPRRARTGMWLATACAAILALGWGVHLQTPASSTLTSAPVVAAMDDDGDSSALDESPDLYLWLGTTDLAME